MTMNSLFDYCVHLLQIWGKFLHMTYEEINIWIFVIIEPIVFVVMLFVIISQRIRITKLKREK
jgi:cytochrome c oxidase subunit IV